MVGRSGFAGGHDAKAFDADRRKVLRPPVVNTFPRISVRLSASVPVHHSGKPFRSSMNGRPGIDVSGTAEKRERTVVRRLSADRSVSLEHIQIADKRVRSGRSGHELDGLLRLAVVRLARARTSA